MPPYRDSRFVVEAKLFVSPAVGKVSEFESCFFGGVRQRKRVAVKVKKNGYHYRFFLFFFLLDFLYSVVFSKYSYHH